jgi:hypothetical protein
MMQRLDRTAERDVLPSHSCTPAVAQSLKTLSLSHFIPLCHSFTHLTNALFITQLLALQTSLNPFCRRDAETGELLEGDDAEANLLEVLEQQQQQQGQQESGQQVSCQ